MKAIKSVADYIICDAFLLDSVNLKEWIDIAPF